LSFEGENAVADTADKQTEAEALSAETQIDKQPVALNRRPGRMPAIVLFLSILVLVGGAAAAYALPNVNIALPNFDGFAELFPRAAASAPKPDPVLAGLKDIQSDQQQNAAALQENGAALRQNTAMLQESAADLASLKQGFTAQQTDLKRISNQLSSLIARVESLQNAVTPLTTSSIPQPKAHGRLASRKRASRLPKPVGPVSVGGAPLGPAPAPASYAG
jgi:hypothetical protein